TSNNVTTQIDGTAPNRIFVVQFQNSSHLLFNPATDLLNFQFWLYEGPAGRFEIHFGTNSGASMDYFASTGFENANATQGTNLLACNPMCRFSDYLALNNQ